MAKSSFDWMGVLKISLVSLIVSGFVFYIITNNYSVGKYFLPSGVSK
jgi:hypothetical protein